MPGNSIAFLFLTIGEICNSEVWAAWFKAANPEQYTIYVHAKVIFSSILILNININVGLISFSFPESCRGCASFVCTIVDTVGADKVGAYKSCQSICQASPRSMQKWNEQVCRNTGLCDLEMLTCWHLAKTGLKVVCPAERQLPPSCELFEAP